MADIVFEVMICSPVTVGSMRRDTWYLESAHATLAEARLHFHRFAEGHPDPRLILVIVQSTYSEATGLFRDRVVQARENTVTTFVRSSNRLTPEGRAALGALFGVPPEHAGRRRVTRSSRRDGPRAAPGRRRLIWAAGLVLALSLTGAAALVFGLVG